QDAASLDDREIILGIDLGDTKLALPMYYMSGFEVANLFLDSTNYLLTWCPLVGSARMYEGDLQGDRSGFDFGRGLKENNLLIIDRKTNSVWNQLSCKAIEGELEGQRLEPLGTVQSTWGFWREKYPESKLLINRDTSNAVFPTEVYKREYYTDWKPGTPYPENLSEHNIKLLGLGLEREQASVFFPLDYLSTQTSPLNYRLREENLVIHFDVEGLTAWAESPSGDLLPSTMVYDWAWENFFPESEIAGKE
ncbi:MAG: DUF3179 domain-containing (seleno)protein, partial [Bacteroidota bacterium]